MDSLTYCIYGSAKELLVLKKIDFDTTNKHSQLVDQLTLIWNDERFLNLSYRNCSVFYIAPHYTIIPNRLYSDTDKATYLLPLKEPSTIKELYLADALSTSNSQLIYAVPQELIQFLDKKYAGSYQLQHSFTSLIKELHQRAGTGREVFVNIRDHALQIFFFDNKELIFSNQFPFESEKDFLYYILLVFDQFKLNPIEVPVKISGALSETSTIYNQLYRYIQQLSFINLPTVFQSDLDLKQYPEHLFFDVLHAE